MASADQQQDGDENVERPGSPRVGLQELGALGEFALQAQQAQQAQRDAAGEDDGVVSESEARAHRCERLLADTRRLRRRRTTGRPPS